jgi:hypothetical protein
MHSFALALDWLWIVFGLALFCFVTRLAWDGLLAACVNAARAHIPLHRRARAVQGEVHSPSPQSPNGCPPPLFVQSRTCENRSHPHHQIPAKSELKN